MGQNTFTDTNNDIDVVDIFIKESSLQNFYKIIVYRIVCLIYIGTNF